MDTGKKKIKESKSENKATTVIDYEKVLEYVSPNLKKRNYM